MSTWSPHSFLFDLTKDDVVLQTDALTVQNIGRTTAETVEIIMNGQPDFFQFAPALPYHEEATDEGNFILRVDSLGPKEFFTLQLLSYTQVPQFLNIRSMAGQAEFMPIQIQRVFPKWFNFAVAVLLLVGLGFLVYWIIRAVVFVSASIGIG